MQSGVIVNIGIFTGKEVNSDWWNTTWFVMIECEYGVINYGEIMPKDGLYTGQEIKEGDLIGKVIPVLKKDKGRPMNMLHIELYEKGTSINIKSWCLDTPKPPHLKDPLVLLAPFLNNINNKRNVLKF